jgi:hypothetical protein
MLDFVSILLIWDEQMSGLVLILLIWDGWMPDVILILSEN